MPNRIYITFLIAAFYIIGAQLGFLLGLLPDTPITVLWPPSGLALAAVLLWGNIALPGIFLGALITNLLPVWDTPTWPMLGACLTISTASTVAAMAAGRLLKRFAPTAPIWGCAADIFTASMVMGLACTIPAGIGSGSLYLSGQLPGDAVPATMGMWWLGDFCGMLVFTPMAFAAARRFKGKFWRKLKPDEVVGPTMFHCIVTMVALATFLFLWILEGTGISQSLEREASIAANSLTQELYSAGRDMASIRAFITVTSQQVTETEFQQYTEALFENKSGNAGVEGRAWVPRITDPKVWEIKMRSTGNMQTSLFELDESGQRISVTKRSEYFPLQYIYPIDDFTHRAIGFDLGSEPLRRQALERARDTGQMSMVAPIGLVSTDEIDTAMFICLPLYRQGKLLDSVADHRANLVGFVTGVFRISTLLNRALANTIADIDLYLFDELLPSHPQLYPIKNSLSPAAVDDGRPVSTPTNLTTDFNGEASIDFAGSRWLLIATPGAKYISPHRTWVPWGALILLLVLGIVISSIMVERISAQKKIDKEQLKTQKALQDARAANESKSYFMAAASHDIKQPLYALGILTDTLLMINPQKSTQPIMKSLRKSIKEMSLHFDTLMDAGRFHDGNFEVALSTVSMSDLSRRINMEIAPLCIAKGLSWNLDVDEVMVYTDAELVLRLIRNLLINAVRYTSDGEVSFSAKARGKVVYCKISDTGEGLSLDHRELDYSEVVHMRGDEIHTSGHGLGLSIVKKLGQALNLGLEVSSDRGNGTVFTFQLPTTNSTPDTNST